MSTAVQLLKTYGIGGLLTIVAVPAVTAWALIKYARRARRDRDT